VIRRVKIFYTTVSTSSQSGATILLFETATMAQELGHQAILALPPGSKGPDGVSVIEIPMSPPRILKSVSYQARFFGGFLPATLRLSREIKKFGADIVHVNEITDLQPAYAAKLAKKPLVWTIRAGFGTTPGLTKRFANIALKHAQAIIVPSRSVRENFFGEDPRVEGCVRVLYDAPRFTDRPSLESREAWRAKLAMAPSDPLILEVSKLNPVKGQRTFIDAAPQILDRYPSAKLLIVGGEVEGKQAYAKGLADRIKELGVEDRVVLFGQSKDVPGLMAASDLVVHCPYFKDPLPGVVLEAMIAERPFVGTRIGGIPEEIEEGVTGLLAEPNNPSALATTVCEALDMPSEQRQAMGAAGRERVLTHFTRASYVKGLQETYANVTRR